MLQYPKAYLWNFASSLISSWNRMQKHWQTCFYMLFSLSFQYFSHGFDGDRDTGGQCYSVNICGYNKKYPPCFQAFEHWGPVVGTGLKSATWMEETCHWDCVLGFKASLPMQFPLSPSCFQVDDVSSQVPCHDELFLGNHKPK